MADRFDEVTESCCKPDFKRKQRNDAGGNKSNPTQCKGGVVPFFENQGRQLYRLSAIAGSYSLLETRVNPLSISFRNSYWHFSLSMMPKYSTA